MKKLAVLIIIICLVLPLTYCSALGVERSWTMPQNDSVSAVCYNPAGNRLMVGRASGKIWRLDVHHDGTGDWSTGSDYGKDIDAHKGRVCDIDFSDDGDEMATCASDHTVKVWMNPSNDIALYRDVLCNFEPFSVNISDDKQSLLVAGEYGVVRHYNIYYRKIIREWNFGATVYAAYYYDSDRIIAGLYNLSGDIVIADFNSGKILKSVPAHVYGITDMVIDKPDNYIITTGYDGTIKIWSYDKLELQKEIHTYSSAVNWIDCNSDRSKIFAASSSGDVSVFETATKRMIARLSSQSTANSLSACLTRNYFAVGFENGVVNIYNY